MLRIPVFSNQQQSTLDGMAPLGLRRACTDAQARRAGKAMEAMAVARVEVKAAAREGVARVAETAAVARVAAEVAAEAALVATVAARALG
jgi:hypothetical protein